MSSYKPQKNRTGGNSWLARASGLAEEIIKTNDAEKASQLLRLIIDQKDELEALNHLMDGPKLGEGVIKVVSNLVSGNDVHLFVQFLDYLGSDKLNVGSSAVSVSTCYTIAYDTPGFLRKLKSSMSELSADEKKVVAWFLAQVARGSADVRENHNVLSIAEALAATLTGDVIQAMITVILPNKLEEGSKPSLLHALPEGALRSLEAVRALEPVHDNDFPLDYRRIGVLPTADELNKAQPVAGLVPVAVKEAALLDRQFRLLREDMLAPIIEELRSLLASTSPDLTQQPVGEKRNHRALGNLRKRMFADPVLVDVAMDSKARNSQPACVLMLVPIPAPLEARLISMKRAELASFLDGPGRRLLAKDSLLLYLDAELSVVSVARVVRREPEELLRYPGYICVGVEFTADHLPAAIAHTRFGLLDRVMKHYEQQQETDGAGKEQVQKNQKPQKKDEGNGKSGVASQKALRKAVEVYRFSADERFAAHVFQASASVFGYEPILQRLQAMVAVPFAAELVQGQAPRPLHSPVPISSEIEKSLRQDPSQLEAVRNAMQKRLCLIQGPPGTGKTYVGVQIVRALLAEAQRTGEEVRVLCLCYTNHALDDFLLSLHEDGGVGFDDMVRLGRSPKIHEKLQDRCLDRLKMGEADRFQRRRFAILKQQQEACQAECDCVKRRLAVAQRRPWRWSTAESFFAHEAVLYDTVIQRAHAQLQATDARQSEGRWKAWCEGKADPQAFYALGAGAGLWALSREERTATLLEWTDKFVSILSDELAALMADFQHCAEQLALVNSESKVAVASRARVLGCTTTAAAKQCDVLAQLRPTVVLVEEAGEILEASVLTALGPSVKQVVMIGDHQQLRPKLECYRLRKESGQGVNFDVSLFERLATQSGFPIITLTEQRRMRPEICDLIRLTTYPQLKDHPSVRDRADLRGVRGNVIFIDHNHPEGEDSHAALLGSSSKTNTHEANMVREIVRYFLQQGYSEQEIVVLTPYLGQLVVLREALRNMTRVELNDLDRQELMSADIDVDDGQELSNPHEKAAGPKLEPPSIRVSTVDNYQGEESRIVVASLVRCNGRGEVGFVAGAERVNVLLSRSRDGLIMLGSQATLRQARAKPGSADWRKILDHLSERGCLHPGFPAFCATHNATPDEAVDSPGMFAKWCPSGGCTKPCNAPLLTCAQGHRCARPCHPAVDPITKRDVHASAPCQVEVQGQCPRGHEVTRLCCRSEAKPCRAEVLVMCGEGLHPVPKQLCYQTIPKDCFACKQEAKKRAKAAERLAQEAQAQREQEAAERGKLSELSDELARAAQLREHEDTVARMQHEQRLVEEEIVRKKKPAKSVAAVGLGAWTKPTEESTEAAPTTLKPTPTTARTPASTLPTGDQAGHHHTPLVGCASVTGAGEASSAADRAAKGVLSTDSPSLPAGATARFPEPAPTPQSTAPSFGQAVPHGAASHEAVPPASTSGPALRVSETQPAKPTMTVAPPLRVEDPALVTVTAMLRLVAEEKWMQLLKQPVVTSAAAQGAGAADPMAQLAQVGVQALLLVAEDKMSPPQDTEALRKRVDALQNAFTVIIDELPHAGDAAHSISVTHALLCYASFLGYRRNVEMRYTARDAGLGYVTLLKTQVAVDYARNFPAEWAAAVKSYSPSQVTPAAARSDRKGSSDGILPPSKAARAWKERVKGHVAAGRKGSSPSAAVDSIMKLTGLEEVKSSIIDTYDRLLIAKEQGTPSAASYNLRCDGNPGTGKTTVARLYCDFLVQMGVLPKEVTIKETSGSKLITDGVRGLTATLEEMKEQGGGVVFVDETYQLNPDQDQSGRQVLDFILPHAEKLHGEYGAIVWIFAGYTDRMDKLFQHNPGLPSRFPHRMNFQDYSDAELMSILLGLLARGGQDISSSPAAKSAKQTPAAKKPASVPVARAGYSPYLAYGSHPDEQDQWGNTWTWDAAQSTFKDEYGNISGYGVSAAGGSISGYGVSAAGGRQLGTLYNPIVSQATGDSWLYDTSKKVFYKQNVHPRVEQSWYPGSPPPVPAASVVRPFTVSDVKWVRVAARRLGRMRGTVGFGNARAVRILFEKARDRQARRISEQRRKGDANVDIMQLTRDDLLGPKANKESLLAGCNAWKELQAMIGLESVKAEVEKLVDLAVCNADLEDDEQPIRGVALNRIFLGNPGTGKTTVARLYGEILSHLGLLSKGDVVLKNASDFIGSALGNSEKATRGILTDSEGCVLVIDEAYSLNPSYGSKAGAGSAGTQDSYRAAVLDTIVEQVQGRPGEDRAVVMLGYRKPMEDMLAAANPGLSRRFQLDNAFEFADYNDEQLMRVLQKKCAEANLQIDLPTAAFAIDQLARARSMPNFGNAGAVDNLLSTAQSNLGPRRSQLRPEDFCRGGVLPKEGGNEQEIFSDLVADANIQVYLRKLQASVKMARKMGRDPKENAQFNLLFVGAPGTGKTTVARRMGEVYHSLQLLPTSDVVEVKAADLIAPFEGQSQKMASEVLHRAKGKVLFIDEAYQLNPAKGGPYMQEAVDTMVQELTSEELAGQMVVILAGYERDIDEMLQVNSGLASRFSKKLHFADFSVDRVTELLRGELPKKGLVLSAEAEDWIPHAATQLCKLPNFSNGRDVKTLAKEVFDAYAERTIDDDETVCLVEVEDLQAAIAVMVASRPQRTAPAANQLVALPVQARAMAREYMHAAPPPPVVHTQLTLTEQRKEEATDQVTELADPAATAASSFGASDNTQFYAALQTLLDQRGLNNKDSVAQLTAMDLNNPYMLELAHEIARSLGTDLASAQELLREWQRKQLDVTEKLREEQRERELAKKQKRKALVPIWRCAVCGQADLNYIFCNVSPFIVRYSEVEVEA